MRRQFGGALEQVGEMGGEVRLAGHDGFQSVQGGIDAGGGFGVDDFPGGVDEAEQPGARRLFAHQGQVDPALDRRARGRGRRSRCTR
jgi:hypothetical protein